MTLHILLLLLLHILLLLSGKMVFANLPTLGEKVDLLVQRIYSKAPQVGEEAKEGHSVRRKKDDMAAGGILIGDQMEANPDGKLSSSSSSHTLSPAEDWCLPPTCRRVLQLVGEEANQDHNAGGILVANPNESMAGKKGGSSWAEAMRRSQVGPAASGVELKMTKELPVNLVVQTIRKDHGERQRMAAAAGGPLLDGNEVHVKEKEAKKKEEREKEVNEKEGKPKMEKEESDRKEKATEKEMKEKRDKEAIERKGKEAEEAEAQVKGKSSREEQDMVTAGGTLIGNQAKRLIARTLKVRAPGGEVRQAPGGEVKEVRQAPGGKADWLMARTVKVRAPLHQEKQAPGGEVKEKSTSGKALWRGLALNKLTNNPGRLAIF